MSYRKKIGSGTKSKKKAEPSQSAITAQSAEAPVEEPGFFAPGHEKALFRALQAYEDENIDEALEYFLEAAPHEPGAAIFAAAIMAGQNANDYRGVELLENVIEWDDEFPTPLMEKYLSDMEIEIDITPNVTVVMPVDGLAATLLLIELYQSQRRVREAIALLEEVDALANEPCLTLSLCELYASRNLWDNIIERAKNTESVDDVTLETMIFFGRALYEKQLYEAAITVFGKALRRTKDRKPTLLHEAMYWRAMSYQAQGKQRQANTEFQKLFAENPDFRDVGQRLEDFALQ